MNGGEVVFTFKGDAKQLTSMATNVGNLIKGSIASKAIAKGFQLISSNIGAAVNRIDTMNAFPKLMQNFGVSTDEANKSIKRIDKSVQGLPTSLNDAVSSVQDLFMVTNDLPQAEKMFQAVNDSAMVFANGSTDASKRFIYAYKQALAQGKVQAQDFNQMNEAIPGLMTKVAQSMGITQAQLKAGLSDGSISMDQFNQALMNLDTKGGAGMESLHKTALTSTGGIATSISNLKTAVVRGVANMIDTMNKTLTANGLPDFQQAIEIAKNIVNQAFTQISNAIKVVIPIISTLIKAARQLAPAITLVAVAWASWQIGTKIQSVVTGFQEAKLALQLYSMQVGSANVAQGVFNGMLKAQEVIVGLLTGKITLAQLATTAFSKAQSILNAVLQANPIGIIITAIGLLVAGFILLWTKCEGFRNFWIGLWQNIQNIVSGAIAGIKNFFNNLISFIQGNWQGILLFIANPIVGAFKLLWDNCEGFRNFWINLWNILKDTVSNIVNGIKTFLFQTVPQTISSVISFLISLPSRVWGIVSQIPSRIAAALSSAAAGARNGAKNIFNSIINGIKSLPSRVLGIGRDIGKGLINGLGSMISGIKGKVDQIANNIKNGLKKALKIGSPSKEMFKIGAFTDQGLLNGLDSMQPQIKRTIDGMVNLSPSLYGTASNSFSPNVNVQVYNSMQTDPLGQVVNNIKTYSGGAKNDFNYGMGY